ncbi:chemotaxis protein CheW [Saccharophagus degradans]|uniref:Chemotaxis protein CheW n=2 Tax=Cellvibrionaceae TaxID=1706371 RepID=A0AAW7X371_9GAMM|nr:chemotaxis protein CheW [Saccharophagus degradans]MDO6421033.1 chemotaxis protein CheW [Saccharophagus degradans]MDO6606056.1 chemotaxis protein CheW [Saccharophagus degradans]
MSTPSSKDSDFFLASYFEELLTDPVPAQLPAEEEKTTAKPVAPKANQTPEKLAEASVIKAPEKKTPKNASLARTEPEALPELHQPIQKSAAASIPAPNNTVTSASEEAPAPQLQPETKTELQQRQAYLEETQKQKLQALLNQGIQLQAPVKTKPQTAQVVIEKVAQKVEQQVRVEQKVQVEQKIQEVHVEVKAPVQEIITVEQQTAAQTGYSLGVNDLLEWHENGRPMWAQERFDVLLFEVSGLTLAVPLVALGQIQPLNENLTPLFGQSNWFMGLLNSAHGKIKTINTALFVMPEKYSETFLETAKYVISIDGVSWGLAVDKVNQPVTLNPSEVKWRGERTKRPWLAGTVKSAMCALIDIPQMAKLLHDSDKNAQKR